jgi:hypothetical protein
MYMLPCNCSKLVATYYVILYDICNFNVLLTVHRDTSLR